MKITLSALKRMHPAFASVIIYLFVKCSESVFLVHIKKAPHLICLLSKLYSPVNTKMISYKITCVKLLAENDKKIFYFFYLCLA